MPAGSTLDLFNSDAGLRVVGDLCAPSVRARVGEPLSLSQVTFVVLVFGGRGRSRRHG